MTLHAPDAGGHVLVRVPRIAPEHIEKLHIPNHSLTTLGGLHSRRETRIRKQLEPVDGLLNLEDDGISFPLIEPLL